MCLQMGGSRGRWHAATALLGFSGLACLWYLPVLAHPLTYTVSGGRGDLTIFAWFLTWGPWGLLHGHNPFLSHYLLWPAGVSTMWNTGLLLLSLLLAPVTLTLGPVASLNVLLIAAPASSAFTAWLLLRRHAGAPAATAGALLYGFGPEMAGQNLGHLQLSILTLPPLIVIAVEDLLRPEGRRAWRTGLRLGLLLSAQLLIGEELLAITAIAVSLWLASLLLTAPRSARAALRPLVAGSAVAIGLTLALCGVPLAYQFVGPLRIHGAIQPGDLAVMRPRDLVWPTPRMLLHWGTGPTHTDISEIGSYLGLPLLALLAWGVADQWRRLAVRVSFLVLVAVEILSLGAHSAQADPGSTSLPWAVFAGIPVVENILPIRLGLAATLAAAVLLALSLDRLRRGRPAVAAVAAALVLLPLLPRGWPIWQASPRPACLRGTALARLTSTEPTLLLPYPRLFAETGQLWQAEAHFPFPIAGGYAVHPDVDTGAPVLVDRDASAVAFDHLGSGPTQAPEVLAALHRLRLRRVLVTPGSAASAERVFLERDLHLTPVPVADCTLYAVP